MADLLDRIRNVYDDHQHRERHEARQEGYRPALHETRDVLLVSALATPQQWRQELQTAGPNTRQEAIHAKYPARLQSLNTAFVTLRQGDAGITTQIDVEQFNQNATERANHLHQKHSLEDNRIERGYDYSIVTEAAYMKLVREPVNSATRISGHSECSVLSCEFSDSRGAAASRLLFRFTLDPLSGYTAVFTDFRRTSLVCTPRCS